MISGLRHALVKNKSQRLIFTAVAVKNPTARFTSVITAFSAALIVTSLLGIKCRTAKVPGKFVSIDTYWKTTGYLSDSLRGLSCKLMVTEAIKRTNTNSILNILGRY